MSDDIKKLVDRLRATFFEETVFSLHDVRDAANALEAMAEKLQRETKAAGYWMERFCAAENERDRLKDEVERLRSEKVAGGPRPEAMGGTPPAAEPAPAVCWWDSRMTVFPMPICNPAATILNRINREGDMCPLCGKPIKFTEVKDE